MSLIFNLLCNSVYVYLDYNFWVESYNDCSNLKKISKIIINNSKILSNTPSTGLFFGVEYQETINYKNNFYTQYYIKHLYFFEVEKINLFNEIVNNEKNFIKIKKIIKESDNPVIINQYTYDYLNSFKNATYLNSNYLKIGIISTFTVFNIYLHFKQL